MATRTASCNAQTDMDGVTIATAGSVSGGTVNVLYNNDQPIGDILAAIDNAKQAIFKDLAG